MCNIINKNLKKRMQKIKMMFILAMIHLMLVIFKVKIALFHLIKEKSNKFKRKKKIYKGIIIQKKSQKKELLRNKCKSFKLIKIRQVKTIKLQHQSKINIANIRSRN